jgi:molecular chaperone HtpG
VLKEGLIAPDGDKEKLLDLVLAGSTDRAAPLASLDQYVSRMKEGQDAIYILSGPADAISKSPLLEGFTAKGYEVLLFSDPVDELWLEDAPKYKDKPLRSIARGDVTLGTEEERKQESDAREQKQRELGDLLTCLRVHLQEQVKDVRLSSRLTSSVACLVTDEHDMTPRMQRMLEQLGHAPAKIKPVLELNPSHAVVSKLEAIFRENSTDPRLPTYAELLFGLAHLADGGQIHDATKFGNALTDLMTR